MFNLVVKGKLKARLQSLFTDFAAFRKRKGEFGGLYVDRGRSRNVF